MKHFRQIRWSHILLVIAILAIITVAAVLKYNVNRARFPDAPPWTWFF